MGAACLLLLLAGRGVAALTLTWNAIPWPAGYTHVGYQLQQCHIIPPATTCTPVDIQGGRVGPTVTSFVSPLPSVRGVDLWAVRAVGTNPQGVAQQSPPSNVVAALSVAPPAKLQALPWAPGGSVSADSREGGEEERRAVDGDPTTYWQTQWRTAPVPYQHWLMFDLGQARMTRCLHYLPRQDGVAQGRIKEFRIEVGMTPQGTRPVLSGTFTPNDASRKTTCWSVQAARYVVFYATSSWNGEPMAAAAEVTLDLEP